MMNGSDLVLLYWFGREVQAIGIRSGGSGGSELFKSAPLDFDRAAHVERYPFAQPFC
jgi:hypothetical protein